jgi:hypothetical protein
LEIIAIDRFKPYIYSIQYDDVEESEFERLFQQWNDMGYVMRFFDTYQEFLKSPIWQNISEPEDAARQVLQEAIDLEDLFDELYDNTVKGEAKDFDSHFHYLEGKYKYELERPPMKSYGTERPSLLRIYAIKMGVNTYLITGGGIKLADSIQNSPELKDHVLKNIDRVREFLKANGIIDSDDMESN